MASSIPNIDLLFELKGHHGIVLRTMWSPDGQQLATTSVDKSINLWNVSEGVLVRVLRGHTQGVNEVAWLPGNHLVSCSYDTSLRIWNLANGDMEHVLHGHTSDVSSVAVSPDGKRIASGSADRTIRVWSIDDRQSQFTLTRHTDAVYRVAWSPDGRWLASSSKDGNVIIWDTEQWREEKRWHFSTSGARGRPTNVCWSRNGERLFAGTFTGTAKLWEPWAAGNRECVLEGHTNLVRSGTFCYDDRLLATSSTDCSVRIWRTDTCAEVARIPEKTAHYWPQGIAFHPSQPILATFGERDRFVRLWRLDIDNLLGNETVVNRYYQNAKVVLVGDTGVGKTALSNALTGEPYKETDSTHARRVVKLWEKEVKTATVTEKRELLLWDLGGQPNYRLLNQLHLNDVAVAVSVFDSREETDPLKGIRF